MDAMGPRSLGVLRGPRFCRCRRSHCRPMPHLLVSCLHSRGRPAGSAHPAALVWSNRWTSCSLWPDPPLLQARLSPFQVWPSCLPQPGGPHGTSLYLILTLLSWLIHFDIKLPQLSGCVASVPWLDQISSTSCVNSFPSHTNPSKWVLVHYLQTKKLCEIR